MTDQDDLSVRPGALGGPPKSELETPLDALRPDAVPRAGEPGDGGRADTPPLVQANPWAALRHFTAARIGLGRAGVSQPTQPQLAFQLAHAQARDAVHLALDLDALQQALAGLKLGCLRLHSAAADRDTYLQRPDLGRRLDAASRTQLTERRDAARGRATAEAEANTDTPATRPYDVAFVVADGLSALAIGSHAQPFLQRMVPRLRDEGWRIAPIALVEQGRVAVADEVGELLGARLVVILIGERPGLSSPDSMGLYMTWMPRVGLTDASRNCISNVRPAGLPYDEAADKLHWLLTEARRRELTGVGLKDETAQPADALGMGARNLLLPDKG